MYQRVRRAVQESATLTVELDEVNRRLADISQDPPQSNPDSATPTAQTNLDPQSQTGLASPAEFAAGAHYRNTRLLIAQNLYESLVAFATSRPELPSGYAPPIVNLPTVPSWISDPGLRQAALDALRTHPATFQIEPRSPSPRRRRLDAYLGARSTGLQPPSSSPRWVPESSITRISPPPPFASDAESSPETETRPSRSLTRGPNAFSEPSRQMCKVRALEVQVGDILKYGNPLSEGCVVTRCHPADPAAGEATEPPLLSPVTLNGPVLIEWKGKWGGRPSVRIEGMETLHVLRVVDDRAWQEDDAGDVAPGSDRDER